MDESRRKAVKRIIAAARLDNFPQKRSMTILDTETFLAAMHICAHRTIELRRCEYINKVCVLVDWEILMLKGL